MADDVVSEMRQPDRIEIRPDHKGRFDEIVARFADGMVHAEMMSNKSLYVGFYWDDGTYLQWWLHSDKKLSSNVEQAMGEPPRYSAQGVDRKPWLPSFAEMGIETSLTPSPDHPNPPIEKE